MRNGAKMSNNAAGCENKIQWLFCSSVNTETQHFVLRKWPLAVKYKVSQQCKRLKCHLYATFYTQTSSFFSFGSCCVFIDLGRTLCHWTYKAALEINYTFLWTLATKLLIGLIVWVTHLCLVDRHPGCLLVFCFMLKYASGAGCTTPKLIPTIHFIVYWECAIFFQLSY